MGVGVGGFPDAKAVLSHVPRGVLVCQEEARKCLVVPLGYWPSHLAVNEPYQTVMMQNARYQVTSGANTGDMAWHHVVSCSMKQLHMLTFQASNCESKAEQV